MPAAHILIEDTDGAMSWAAERALQRRGYVVDSCPGPSQLAQGCPIVTGGRCAKVEEADAVLFALGRDDQDVLGAVRDQFPDLPVVVEALPDELADIGELAEGCETVSRLASGDGIAAAFARALTAPSRS